MEKNDLTIHACNQVLRFTSAPQWHDLTEERKVQLGFNLGLMAMGLGLSKEDGYMVIQNVRTGAIPMQAMHQHARQLMVKHGITIDEEWVKKAF